MCAGLPAASTETGRGVTNEVVDALTELVDKLNMELWVGEADNEANDMG